jgi:hypothetical protein
LVATDAHAQLSLGAVAAALTSGEGYGTHVRTAAYFSCFLGALAAVAVTLPCRALLRRHPLVLLSVPIFSLTALVLTWRLILIFMVAFTAHHADHLDPPNLFVEVRTSRKKKARRGKAPHVRVGCAARVSRRRTCSCATRPRAGGGRARSSAG